MDDGPHPDRPRLAPRGPGRRGPFFRLAAPRRATFELWRNLLREKIEAVARQYPPQAQVNASHLADAFTVVLEGAFITAKAMNEPQVVADQLRLYRNTIELLFRQPGKDR